MKRYVMTRRLAGGVSVVVRGGAGVAYDLPHLVHKSKVLDWTQGTGPGAGHAPSDLARSIVGDVTGEPDPSPRKYQLIKSALVATLPEKGGTITEDEVLQVLRDYLDEVSR